nr:caudovirus prohead protease [uncultured Neisseria sp.]
MAKLYAEIAKMEAQDDGTVKVWGYASSEAVDSDGEIIAAEAMKAAIPDYMKFGAVREMHGSNAAGTAIEINVEDDGRTFFGAHIVDPVAVTKVKTGVYKGFSIGGSVTARDELNKSQITGLKLTEISLVDRPANPDAVFTCYKADKPKADEEAEKEEDDKPSDKSAEGKDEKPKDGDKEPEAEDKDGKDDKGDKEDDEDDKKDETEKSESINLSESEIILLKTILARLEKSSVPDSLAKAESANELAKAQDALKKSDDALAKAQAEIESLKKQAAPPKGSTKAISKAEDNGEDPLKGFKPIVKNDGSLDDVATLIKAAQTGRL